MKQLYAGDPVKWVIFRSIKLAILYLLLGLGCWASTTLLAKFNANCILISYAYWILIVATLPLSIGDSIELLQQEFWVDEDFLFFGIDLWLVESCSTGRHCIYLDNQRIDGIPNPDSLLQSLNEVYQERTGGVLF